MALFFTSSNRASSSCLGETPSPEPDTAIPKEGLSVTRCGNEFVSEELRMHSQDSVIWMRTCNYVYNQ